MVDAPVSGSVATAESAGLLIMAGGTEEDIERVRPVLETTSSAIVRLGDQGSGALMKVCVNAILFGLVQGLAENLVVAERSGIDREAAFEVIVRSAIGAPAIQYRRTGVRAPGRGPADVHDRPGDEGPATGPGPGGERLRGPAPDRANPRA